MPRITTLDYDVIPVASSHTPIVAKARAPAASRSKPEVAENGPDATPTLPPTKRVKRREKKQQALEAVKAIAFHDDLRAAFGKKMLGGSEECQEVRAKPLKLPARTKQIEMSEEDGFEDIFEGEGLFAEDENGRVEERRSEESEEDAEAFHEPAPPPAKRVIDRSTPRKLNMHSNVFRGHVSPESELEASSNEIIPCSFGATPEPIVPKAIIKSCESPVAPPAVVPYFKFDPYQRGGSQKIEWTEEDDLGIVPNEPVKRKRRTLVAGLNRTNTKKAVGFEGFAGFAGEVEDRIERSKQTVCSRVRVLQMRSQLKPRALHR
jgi:hypothetical protein